MQFLGVEAASTTFSDGGGWPASVEPAPLRSAVAARQDRMREEAELAGAGADERAADPGADRGAPALHGEHADRR